MSDGLLGRIERRATRFLHRKTIPMRNTQGVVSFTFDDVPTSACTTGREILESHDCFGTYYVSGGLTGQPRDGDSGRFHDADELRALADAGHELGCHGFGHHSVQASDRATWTADLDRNEAFFAELGLDLAPRNYAYPLGHVTPAAKSEIGRRYVSARSVGRGLHKDSVDLAQLRATPIGPTETSEAEIAAMIDEAERERGWLIFVTHGVVEEPDPWGCTPQLLDFAVRKAAGSGCRVLTVAHALGHIAFRPE